MTRIETLKKRVDKAVGTGKHPFSIYHWDDGEILGGYTEDEISQLKIDGLFMGMWPLSLFGYGFKVSEDRKRVTYMVRDDSLPDKLEVQRFRDRGLIVNVIPFELPYGGGFWL